jgi:hypothetical protein
MNSDSECAPEMDYRKIITFEYCKGWSVCNPTGRLILTFESLSRMNRKVHVRFLGGKGVAMPLTYPTKDNDTAN